MKRKISPKKLATVDVEWTNRDGAKTAAIVEVHVDLNEVALQLARKAVESKGKRSQAMRGAIVTYGWIK